MTVKMALSSNEEYNLDQEVSSVQQKYWKPVGRIQILICLKSFPLLCCSRFPSHLAKKAQGIKKEYRLGSIYYPFLPRKNEVW